MADVAAEAAAPAAEPMQTEEAPAAEAPAPANASAEKPTKEKKPRGRKSSAAATEAAPTSPAGEGRAKRERKQPEVFKPEVKEKAEFVVEKVGAESGEGSASERTVDSRAVDAVRRTRCTQGKGSKLGDIPNGGSVGPDHVPV